jgi:hypothetical protein
MNNARPLPATEACARANFSIKSKREVCFWQNIGADGGKILLLLVVLVERNI